MLPKQTNGKIRLFQGCITALKCDAIVNAAHRTLRGGGGVDGAIHKQAGNDLFKHCKALPLVTTTPEARIKTGDAIMTPGFLLPAENIIHCLGPRNKNGAVLKKTYLSCLTLAEEKGLNIIAFPCLATGDFGFPQKKAAKIAVDTVLEFLKTSKSVQKVIFCVFQQADRKTYERLLQKTA